MDLVMDESPRIGQAAASFLGTEARMHLSVERAVGLTLAVAVAMEIGLGLAAAALLAW
jgi:hypothetical protein